MQKYTFMIKVKLYNILPFFSNKVNNLVKIDEF